MISCGGRAAVSPAAFLPENPSKKLLTISGLGISPRQAPLLEPAWLNQQQPLKLSSQQQLGDLHSGESLNSRQTQIDIRQTCMSPGPYLCWLYVVPHHQGLAQHHQLHHVRPHVVQHIGSVGDLGVGRSGVCMGLLSNLGGGGGGGGVPESSDGVCWRMCTDSIVGDMLVAGITKQLDLKTQSTPDAMEATRGAAPRRHGHLAAESLSLKRLTQSLTHFEVSHSITHSL